MLSILTSTDLRPVVAHILASEFRLAELVSLHTQAETTGAAGLNLLIDAAGIKTGLDWYNQTPPGCCLILSRLTKITCSEPFSACWAILKKHGSTWIPNLTCWLNGMFFRVYSKAIPLIFKDLHLKRLKTLLMFTGSSTMLPSSGITPIPTSPPL